MHDLHMVIINRGKSKFEFFQPLLCNCQALLDLVRVGPVAKGSRALATSLTSNNAGNSICPLVGGNTLLAQRLDFVSDAA